MSITPKIQVARNYWGVWRMAYILARTGALKKETENSSVQFLWFFGQIRNPTNARLKRAATLNPHSERVQSRYHSRYDVIGRVVLIRRV